MNRLHNYFLGLLFAGAALACLATPSTAEAFGYRQAYSSWNYHPTSSYYYTRYSYTPTVTTTSYHHHYCVYYPSQPRYVYYYNPVRRVYWGRYDLQESGYSMLKEEDRKEDLKAIPESAFPKPSKMPAIPESDDGVAMAPPPAVKDLPKVEAADDAPPALPAK